MALINNARVVSSHLGAHGSPGDALGIEIAERTLLSNDEQGRGTPRHLHDAGVAVIIDDLGTGYWAPSTLAKAPGDVPELDRSFVIETAHHHRARQVTARIQSIASGLEMRGVAERVETDPQRSALHATGFPHGQGYRFSNPRPATLRHELLATNTSPLGPSDAAAPDGHGRRGTGRGSGLTRLSVG